MKNMTAQEVLKAIGCITEVNEVTEFVLETEEKANGKFFETY